MSDYDPFPKKGAFCMVWKIALLQFAVCYGKPEENEQKVEALFKQAVDQGSHLVMLPEMWTTGYDLARLEQTADENGRRVKKMIGSLARRHNTAVIAGSVPVKRETGVTNTMFVFDEKGRLLLEYDKVHLFRLMNEDQFLVPGEKKGLFSLFGSPCAGLICYDIRFPEWVRAHVLAGARLLFVAAEWPLERLDHWKTLLRARAIENQCYVVAANGTGSDPRHDFAGHSLVVDPWGEITASAGREETVVMAEVDPEKVQKIRMKIPVFSDRQPEMYGGV